MSHPRAARQLQTNEIADHPTILYDHSVPREQMLLHGVKLGDGQSAIATSRIDHTRDNWIVCDDKSRYRIADGRVVALGVWDDRILAQLNIHSPADIEARFGKPEKTDQTQDIFIDYYDSGHLTVIWNKFEGQINAVNVRANANDQ